MVAALKHKEQSHTDGNTLKTITQIRQSRKTGTNKKGTIETENQNGLEKTDELEHNWWERLPTMFNRSLDKITSSRAKVQRHYRERYNSIPRQTGSTPTQATKARRA